MIRHDKQLVDPQAAERLRHHHDTAELAAQRERRDRAELTRSRRDPLAVLGAWVCLVVALALYAAALWVIVR